jgi:cell wall-associated NlpC family hydrolase
MQNWYSKFFKIGSFFLLACCLAACATQDLRPVLKTTPQNTWVYLNPATENKLLLSTSAQQQVAQTYLRHYFSPWSGKQQVLTLSDIQQAENDYIQKFSQTTYWGEDQHRLSASWLNTLFSNMQLATFAKHVAKAITINTTNLRVLPSTAPAFSEQNGYPFDELQQSLVAANTPILILQTSRDKAWDLVLTHYTAGWLPAQDIAYVDNKFIKQWQTKEYVVSIRDGSPIITTDNQFAFLDRLGNLHPVSKNKFLVAVADANRQAVIKTVFLNKNSVTSFPLSATQKNIAVLANQLLATPYNWGGLYGERDCSATMQDLFAVVGIWLPRNSHDQVKTGNTIALGGLSSEQKEKTIYNSGVPFFSLIGLPGHIMLYIGERNGKLYVLHDTWGLPTIKLWGSGRAVLGETVITPLELGQNYINIKSDLLSRVDGLAIISLRTAVGDLKNH